MWAVPTCPDGVLAKQMIELEMILKPLENKSHSFPSVKLSLCESQTTTVVFKIKVINRQATQSQVLRCEQAL